MIKSIIALLAISLTGPLGFSEELKITCDQATTVGRSASIQKVQYILDTATGAARLGCTDAVQNASCAAIRLDLSRALSTLRTSCQSSGATATVTYRFYLAHEDDQENLVTIDLTQSCATGQINVDGAIVGTVVAFPTGEFASDPISTESVKCSAMTEVGFQQ